MTHITLDTVRFGEVKVDPAQVLQFVAPILGFEKSLRYVVLDHAEESPFKWLQSMDEPDLAFVVTNPALFGIPYSFDLADTWVEQLSISTPEEILVLTIVNVPQEDPSKLTANLIGPIVINETAGKAMQVVLNDSPYHVKTRLLPDEPPKKSTPPRLTLQQGD